MSLWGGGGGRGGNEYGIPGQIAYFCLIMLLKCNFFQGFILHPITGTGSMQGHAAQIVFKVETLLNNALKMFITFCYM